jgi:hypothetical protein
MVVVWFYGRLVLATVTCSGTIVSSGDGRQVLGTVTCSGDGRLVLRTVTCSGDGHLFWRRSPVLATVTCSGDGHLFWRRLSGSGDGRLVLATIVWFWSQSSGYRSGAFLSKEDVRKEGRKEGRVKVAFRCTRGMQRHV